MVWLFWLGKFYASWRQVPARKKQNKNVKGVFHVPIMNTLDICQGQDFPKQWETFPITKEMTDSTELKKKLKHPAWIFGQFFILNSGSQLYLLSLGKPQIIRTLLDDKEASVSFWEIVDHKHQPYFTYNPQLCTPYKAPVLIVAWFLCINVYILFILVLPTTRDNQV